MSPEAVSTAALIASVVIAAGSAAYGGYTAASAEDPKIPDAVKAPNEGDAQKRASDEAERLGLLRRAAGTTRRRTILTTGQGDITPATVHRANLLGGTQ